MIFRGVVVVVVVVVVDAVVVVVVVDAVLVVVVVDVAVDPVVVLAVVLLSVWTGPSGPEPATVLALSAPATSSATNPVTRRNLRLI